MPLPTALIERELLRESAKAFAEIANAQPGTLGIQGRAAAMAARIARELGKPNPLEVTERILGYPAACVRHCTVCEGRDHHWMPDCDEETGEPIMVCKHCDAQREMLDEDELV